MMDRQAFLDALDLLISQCPRELLAVAVVAERDVAEASVTWSCCPACSLALLEVGAEAIREGSDEHGLSAQGQVH